MKEGYERIFSITRLRNLVSVNGTLLEAIQLPQDQLKSSRDSVIRRMAKYLDEETDFTIEVEDEIRGYVKTIWKLQPQKFEEEYLNKIAPLPFLDETWRRVANFGVSFFKVLDIETTLPITSSE